MIKENFENYVDGKVVDESEIATVINHYEDLVIFQNDRYQLFFLSVESPELFEVGTVYPIKGLQPLIDTHPQYQKVHVVLKGDI